MPGAVGAQQGKYLMFGEENRESVPKKMKVDLSLK